MTQYNRVNGWRDELLIAALFLTRLPIRREGAIPDGALAEAARAFPVIGAGVGLVGGLAFAIALYLNLPPLAAGFLVVATTTALTGALHEDGLADSADGLIGGDTTERRLEIMRDSQTGVFGVLALVFTVGLRAAALASLPQAMAAAALIAAHAASRALLPAVMIHLEPARTDGLAADAGRPSETSMRWSLAIGAVVALASLGVVSAVLALAAALAVVAAMARLARRRIGGYTGDVLGACQQLAEVVMLLVAAALS
ncbi:MAG: adenosylcobinamide-GDP ribazoletransferase [Proteobacteria bacterium]|nr:adenosylcobinamide-GDP ribazoletransferase [Pseudomonadota bacterium]MBI3500066.1 adenosylcobinamide-GDP ribazoletransferase [Pseudomonadota bacterium]